MNKPTPTIMSSPERAAEARRAQLAMVTLGTAVSGGEINDEQQASAIKQLEMVLVLKGVKDQKDPLCALRGEPLQDAVLSQVTNDLRTLKTNLEHASEEDILRLMKGITGSQVSQEMHQNIKLIRIAADPLIAVRRATNKYKSEA